MSATTINDAEVAKFSALAEQWWDPAGQLKPLHKINPVRLAYIREHALDQFGLDGTKRHPLTGLKILDIGCGGGLLCEPMARLGAEVSGVDASKRNIAIAKVHAEQSGLKINYKATTSEDLAASGERFDMVLNMEVVEHVSDVPLFLKSCCTLVKPGGLVFIATINRTAKAYALTILGAEYILRWLPRGTHSFSKFLTPEEIISIIGRNSMSIRDKCGVSYNPLNDQWRKSRDMNVNYMLVAEKKG